jgi:hypothetical protein
VGSRPSVQPPQHAAQRQGKDEQFGPELPRFLAGDDKQNRNEQHGHEQAQRCGAPAPEIRRGRDDLDPD